MQTNRELKLPKDGQVLLQQAQQAEPKTKEEKVQIEDSQPSPPPIQGSEDKKPVKEKRQALSESICKAYANYRRICTHFIVCEPFKDYHEFNGAIHALRFRRLEIGKDILKGLPSYSFEDLKDSKRILRYLELQTKKSEGEALAIIKKYEACQNKLKEIMGRIESNPNLGFLFSGEKNNLLKKMDKLKKEFDGFNEKISNFKNLIVEIGDYDRVDLEIQKLKEKVNMVNFDKIIALEDRFITLLQTSDRGIYNEVCDRVDNGLTHAQALKQMSPYFIPSSSPVSGKSRSSNLLTVLVLEKLKGKVFGDEIVDFAEDFCQIDESKGNREKPTNQEVLQYLEIWKYPGVMDSDSYRAFVSPLPAHYLRQDNNKRMDKTKMNKIPDSRAGALTKMNKIPDSDAEARTKKGKEEIVKILQDCGKFHIFPHSQSGQTLGQENKPSPVSIVQKSESAPQLPPTQPKLNR